MPKAAARKQPVARRSAPRAQIAPTGKDRSKYLGGSDAAAALGVSPWRSRFRLWCEKTGGEIIPDISLRSWVEWGNILEPVVADVFAKKQGVDVAVEMNFLTHPKYPFLGAHLDRRIVGANGFLECKTTNAYDNRMWGMEEEGVDGVPAHYVAQCDHYMMVGNFDFCWVAVLIGGSDYRMYRIERSAQREAALLAAELSIWKLIVDEEAPPVFSEDDAKMRWKLALEGTAVEVDALTESHVRALALVQERRKLAEKEEKVLRDLIFPRFEDRQALSVGGERIAELVCYTQQRFDSDSLKQKHPKIASRFYKPSAVKKLKLLV